MIITCGECDSSFILDDSLVKSSGSKVRCSNCKNVFVVFPAKPAVEPELNKPAVTKKATDEFDGVEESYDYKNDPDLSKAVDAIDEKDLEFTDDELGITSLDKKHTAVKAAAAVPEPVTKKPEAKISIPEPVSAPVDVDMKKPVSDEEEILDFADFEMEMDDEEEEPVVSSVSDNDEDLNLNLDDEMDVGDSDDDLELDLMPDSDEEEDLDFSDLELELDGKMNDTEMLDDSLAVDEMDRADTVVVEELQLDLSDNESMDVPTLPEEDDLSFDEKESDSVMMVDDELDFSDLERELDGISDEPASVDELDLGLDADEASVESETIMMDGDELDFSDFEFDDEESKASDKKAKKEAQEAEDELDFSNLASILDSEPPPQEKSKDTDEDLDLELDLDLDGDGDSGKASSIDDEEEELDFSDLEDLLDDLEKADAAAAAGKQTASEDLDLELDVALDEDIETSVSGKESALTHDEEDLDFSDVEAMLDLDEGGIDEKLAFEGSNSELDLELEMDDSDSKNFIKIGNEEDPDIELELDMGDDEKDDEENELLELEEDDEDEEGMMTTGQEGAEKALTDKAESKKKVKPKPKRRAPGRGKNVVKYVVYALVVLFILFFFYMAKNAIGINIPNIGPLEQLRDSISKMGIPVISSFVAPQDKDAQGKFNLKTSQITGKIIPNSKLGELFVITGNVQNMYPETRSSISLVCKLFGRNGSVSQTELFYAGNIIPEAELSKMDAAMIKKRIQNRLGDKDINAKVRPNQVVPFMVVFTRLGDNLTEFSVEPAGSMPGSAK